MSPPERQARRAVVIRQAIALGLLHGPTELLPISSSGHLGAVPWLLGWSYTELEGEQRKSFEVALHAGTAAALLVSRRNQLRRALEPGALSLIAVATVPAVLVGFGFEDAIEQQLGTPATIAIGLVAGSVAMVAADRRPERRGLEDAGVRDAICLGLAQATALVPGISRHGAALAAARLRQFRRADAHRFSELTALAPIMGAVGLRMLRHRQRPEPGLAVGALCAFVSALACERFMRGRRADGALWRFAAYRIGLAAVILRALMRESRARQRRWLRP